MRLRRWAVEVPLSLAALVALMPAHPATAAFPGANGLIAAELGFVPDGCEAVGGFGWIVTMRSDGSAFRRLTNCEGRPRSANVSSPDWSPDGRQMLFASPRGVVVMAADGSRRRVVTPPAQHGEVISDPSFAPDGRRFVYERNGSGGSVIWRGRTDGGGRRRLVRGSTPRWSPDGRTIAYITGGGDMRLLAARTGKLIRRLGYGPLPGGLDWSPDGRHLVLGGPNLRIVRADGESYRSLDVFDARAGDAVFSPDGRRIALVETERREEGDRHSIWTMTVRGTGKRRIYRSDFIDSEETGAPQLAWGPRPR
jgi:Tol biopolymer transport system component